MSVRVHQNDCTNMTPSMLAHTDPVQNLMSPTKKDFEHLVAFLLRQLDPHWRLLGKLEDEVPAMLAWLKYPFQVRTVTHAQPWQPHMCTDATLMHGWHVARLRHAATTPQALSTCPRLSTRLLLGAWTRYVGCGTPSSQSMVHTPAADSLICLPRPAASTANPVPNTCPVTVL